MHNFCQEEFNNISAVSFSTNKARVLLEQRSLQSEGTCESNVGENRSKLREVPVLIFEDYCCLLKREQNRLMASKQAFGLSEKAVNNESSLRTRQQKLYPVSY